MNIYTSILLAALAASSFSLIGCGPSETGEGATVVHAVPCTTPLEVIPVPDQSGSMKHAGTSPVTVDDLEPFFDQIVECGGSIALLFVRERPDDGIVKFRLDQPTSLPEPPVKKLDEEEYEFLDRQSEYDAFVAKRNQEMESREANARPQWDAFKQRAKALLARAAAGSTDLNSALNIADVYLAQDDGWKSPPKKFILLVSDGQDTARRPRYRIKSIAKIFWVNGQSDPRALAGKEAARFADLESGIRAVIGELRGGTEHARTR